jgi:hypothetical protein
MAVDQFSTGSRKSVSQEPDKVAAGTDKPAKFSFVRSADDPIRPLSADPALSEIYQGGASEIETGGGAPPPPPSRPPADVVALLPDESSRSKADPEAVSIPKPKTSRLDKFKSTRAATIANVATLPSALPPSAERGRRSVGLAAAYWDSRTSGRVISSRRSRISLRR